MSYNITNAETLCIHCQGWGKVLENQNNKNSKYINVGEWIEECSYLEVKNGYYKLKRFSV